MLYYAEGLLLRGCPKNFLLQSWDSFASSHLAKHRSARQHLTQWYRETISKLTEHSTHGTLSVDILAPQPRACHSREAMPRPVKPAATVALLCGLHAVNAALQVLHRPPLNRDKHG